MDLESELQRLVLVRAKNEDRQPEGPRSEWSPMPFGRATQPITVEGRPGDEPLEFPSPKQAA